jgi:ferredoxin, 2Fe-2S
MTRVLLQPSGIEFEADVGETLMGAAQARGLYWPTTCGGQGICTTCLSEVVSGGEALAEMSRYERKTLLNERGEAALRRAVRLACQAAIRAEGDLVISKAGVRAAGSP